MGYDIGDQVTLSVTFRDTSGVLTNPTTVALTIELPNGGSVSPTPTNTSTGLYTYAYTTTTSGLHYAKWTATGTVVAVEYDTFHVRSEDESHRLTFPNGLQSWESAVY